MNNKLNVSRLGLIEYGQALELQQKLQMLQFEESIDDTLLLLEHYPVLTLGRRGKYENLLVKKEFLEKEKVSIHVVNRGGDITYHGPGQLVGYLVFNLKNHGSDIKEFVYKIQEVFIRFLHDEYDIESCRNDKVFTGVWARNEKITAIGISVKHWITMHGFSFNINTDMEHFKWINPCGISDKGVTSLEKLTGKRQDFDKAVEKISDFFCTVFKMERIDVKKENLLSMIENKQVYSHH